MSTTTNTLGPRTNDIIGRSWAGFRIVRLVGEGGQGSVYLAINDLLAGKKIAIKVLLPEVASNPAVVERFFAEARAAAALDDPNIVDIIDAGAFPDGRHYIAMPFLEGCSLEQLCEERGPLALDLAAPILWQVGSALHVAHLRAIVHRDLKGHNVFLTNRWGRRNFVVLLDFGIAKLVDPMLGGVHTNSGLLMGSPHYMAPELARGAKHADARADVYSMGVLAYRVLTGRRPYGDDALGEVIAKQANRTPFPRPRDLRPDLPPAIDRAIMGALEIDPEHRTATAKEFTLQLIRAIPNSEAAALLLCPRLFDTAATLPSELTIRPDMVTPTPWTAAISMVPASVRKRSSARGVAGAALAGLAIGGVGVYAVAHRGGTESAAPAVAIAPVIDAASARHTSDAAIEQPAASVSAAPPDATPAASSPPDAAPPPPPAPPDAALPSAPVDAGAPIVPDRGPRVVRTLDTGSIVVKAHPWAEVWIDGKSEGTTPVRVKVSIGRHRVRLVNDTASKDENVSVNVVKDKDTEVDRTW